MIDLVGAVEDFVIGAVVVIETELGYCCCYLLEPSTTDKDYQLVWDNRASYC